MREFPITYINPPFLLSVPVEWRRAAHEILGNWGWLKARRPHGMDCTCPSNYIRFVEGREMRMEDHEMMCEECAEMFPPKPEKIRCPCRSYKPTEIWERIKGDGVEVPSIRGIQTLLGKPVVWVD